MEMSPPNGGDARCGIPMVSRASASPPFGGSGMGFWTSNPGFPSVTLGYVCTARSAGLTADHRRLFHMQGRSTRPSGYSTRKPHFTFVFGDARPASRVTGSSTGCRATPRSFVAGAVWKTFDFLLSPGCGEFWPSAKSKTEPPEQAMQGHGAVPAVMVCLANASTRPGRRASAVCALIWRTPSV